MLFSIGECRTILEKFERDLKEYSDKAFKELEIKREKLKSYKQQVFDFSKRLQGIEAREREASKLVEQTELTTKKLDRTINELYKHMNVVRELWANISKEESLLSSALRKMMEDVSNTLSSLEKLSAELRRSMDDLMRKGRELLI